MYKIIITIVFIIFLVFVIYDINNTDNIYDMIWFYDKYDDHKYKLHAIDHDNNVKYKIELDCDSNINSNYIQIIKPYNSHEILSRGFLLKMDI
jgi:hypothetical protein